MVSVVLASYNGEKYIKKQLESILIQLNPNDEIIISDDGSTDSTLNIVSCMMASDSRIKVIQGPRQGYNKNFESAIRHASGVLLFLIQRKRHRFPCLSESNNRTFYYLQS